MSLGLSWSRHTQYSDHPAPLDVGRMPAFEDIEATGGLGAPVPPSPLAAGTLAGADRSTPRGRAALEDGAARALLDSLGQGDTHAFWELWSIYRAHLYHICLSHMDGVREDAEDALSRAMLRANDKLPHIGTHIENIRAWLTRLTVNLCADMHRERKRRTRRLEHIEDVLASLDDAPLVEADSPEDALLSREAYVCMCEAVNDLPDRLREPFALRFFHEMAYIEIAQRLILTNENVRKRIQQARDILKQRLHETVALDALAPWPAHGRRAGGATPLRASLRGPRPGAAAHLNAFTDDAPRASSF
jgi:RNA polymerase sigma factor (sigma-70 family)